jgi:hypothetical protein
MQAVGSQQNEDHEVGNQQSYIEGVGLIQALESGIQKVLAEILHRTVRRQENGQRWEG